MRKFGLKLWTTGFINNKDFIKDAERALKDGKFDYLELYVIPETYEETKNTVAASFSNAEVVIHAPHNSHNLNTSDPNQFENNKTRLKSSQQFADLLHADKIILHPGSGSGEVYLAETIRQFKAFNENRLIVENMPGYCSNSLCNLHGSQPSEIKRIIEEANVGFCLDFSHAICGANHHKQDVYTVLDEYKSFNPAMYHLCDGDITSTNDDHLHYGTGNYDLRRIVLEYTANNAIITMETGAGLPANVTPWINDINYIHKLIA